MTKYNIGFDIESMVSELDPGLERAVLRKLSFHVGRDNAVSRQELTKSVHLMGYRVDERAVRLVINQLRKQGVPICATGGHQGGYWMAADWQELEEFLDREHRARIKDLSEQVTALTRAGRERWGENKQGRLF
jgi:hypothetical protein